jgi:diaminopimelate epimerase
VHLKVACRSRFIKVRKAAQGPHDLREPLPAPSCLSLPHGIPFWAMEIEFLKMQGCGDDSVIADAARIPLEAHSRFPLLARRILDRGFGVGGNALVVLARSDDADLSVRCFDPDGDETAIPCNAARCAARYAADSGAVTSGDFSIGSMDKRLRAQIIDSANVRVDLGVPVSRETQAEMKESARDVFTRRILVEGRSVSYTPISLGRSYAMLFVPDFSFAVRKTARTIASQPDFPAGTGIGFVQVISREEMKLKVWEDAEDDPGDECACAAAAVVAAVVSGFTDREVFVHLRDGDIFLQWEEADNHIWVTGPTAYVFTGTFDFNEGGEE